MQEVGKGTAFLWYWNSFGYVCCAGTGNNNKPGASAISKHRTTNPILDHFHLGRRTTSGARLLLRSSAVDCHLADVAGRLPRVLFGRFGPLDQEVIDAANAFLFSGGSFHVLCQHADDLHQMSRQRCKARI